MSLQLFIKYGKIDMNLNDEFIYLKRLSMDELSSNYVNWLNDREVCKYNSHDGDYTIEMAIDFITSLENDVSKEVYAIYHKEDNVHVGNIALQQINRQNSSAEIAFLIGEKKYWNKGIGFAAAQILLKRAFETLQLHRIHMGTSSLNIAMQKLAVKLGFEREGCLKDAQYKNNQFNDIILYGLVKSK